MRLNFLRNGIEYDLNIDKISEVMSPNSGGKTTFLNFLKDGFEGKLKAKFIVNGNVVEKDDYKVFFIGDLASLDIEASITTKSIYRSLIDQNLDFLDDELCNDINEALINLENSINNFAFDFGEDYYNFSAEFKIDLKNLISKNTSIVFENERFDDLSFTKKRLGYIKLIIDTIKIVNQPSVLLIDEYDLALSDYEFQKFCAQLFLLVNNYDLHIIVSTSKYHGLQTRSIFLRKNFIKNELVSFNCLCSLYCFLNGIELMDFYEYYNLEEQKKMISEVNFESELIDYFLSDLKLEIPESYKKCLILDS